MRRLDSSQAGHYSKCVRKEMLALSDDDNDNSDDTDDNEYKFKVSAFVCPDMHTKQDIH